MTITYQNLLKACNTMGKRKYIESPERMWELFQMYKEEVNKTPFNISDWVGKDAKEVKRQYTRALIMEGFECFVMDHTKITYPYLTEYFEGKNQSYANYFPVCSRIKLEIRRDQIDKGLANLINPSITQRLNNITENVKNQVETKDTSHTTEWGT